MEITNGVLSSVNDSEIKNGVFMVPEGVTSIGDYAFYGCKSLESINIPEGVTSIGDFAFYGCQSLESINIPKGVTSIGDSAFDGCQSLESINIPKGVTTIGDYAFCGCQSLKSINIPKGVLTSIGYHAFYGCQSLESIKIPEGLTSIGDYTFSECESLKPHDKNEIIDEALKLLPNHDGLCACLEKATRNLSLKHKVAISVISSLPKFNREEAMAFGADNENSYWWPMEDKESRKVFLEYLREN